MRKRIPRLLAALLTSAAPGLAATPGFHPPVSLPLASGLAPSEPSVAVAKQGRIGARFVSWQSPGEVATSLDGVNFTNRGLPQSGGSGDVTNAIDASGALFLGQFCSLEFDLHACVQRSTDGGQTWPQTTSLPADMHPGAADRPWIDVYPHVSATQPWNPDATRVYLEYHTFSPEDLAYVTVSTDGGKTFSPPKLITTDTNAISGSACDTVPGGLAVDDRDGTVYVVWASGNDVEANAVSGCNYTQIGPFNKVWVSTSTDGGESWASHLAWAGAYDPVNRVGDNASKIFPTIAVDEAGQVHVLMAVRPNDGLAVVGDPSAALQDTRLLLVTSPDHGSHWTPPAILTPGLGSNLFPWIAAGAAGVVDAIYYTSTTRRPGDAASVWYIAFAQTTGAVAVYSGGPSASYLTAPQVQEVPVDPSPIHNGGICTLGLFCAASGGDRSLADSISIALDPAGGANLVWTDNAGSGGGQEIRFACQNVGWSAGAGPDLNGCYGPADLAVATAAPDAVAPGAILTYHHAVSNNGASGMPATTGGVTLTIALPAGVNLASATPSAGSCSGSGPVVCTLGILPGEATATVDVAVSVAAGAAGPLVESAVLTADTTDPVPGNNSATHETRIETGPPAISFFTVAPCRFYDSRIAGAGLPLPASAIRRVSAVGACGVPAGAAAVSINLTAVAPTGAGNLVLFPGDVALPVTNTVNFTAGQTRANNAVMGLSPAGELALVPAIAGSGTVHVVLDVNGYFQ